MAEAVAGSDTFILLAIGPQCFMALSYRRAVAAVGVLNAVPLGVALARDHGEAAVTQAVAIAVLGTAFCVAFGTWIIKIIDQSAERAELITQLEATRAELAEVSREAGIRTEVLGLVFRGLTNLQIGRALFVSEATVKTHLMRACAKLGVAGRTAAVTKAMEVGALPPPGGAGRKLPPGGAGP